MTPEPMTLNATRERFSARLRTATRPDHGDTEQTAYMTALLEGRLTRDQYAALIGQLHFVYDVLEEAADRMRGDEVAGRFDLPVLRRRAGLQSDLAFYYGPDWTERVRPNDATRRYCDRMREVCFDWPAGFVAHHYTRYLGDMSGGQVIRKSAERAYGFGGDDGVGFYNFPEIPDYKAFKVEYRDRLNALGLDEVQRKRVIGETLLAYQLNTEVLADLGKRMSEFQVA